MSLLNIKVNSPNNELTSEQISALTNNNNTILFDKNTGLINVSNTHFGGNNPNQYITITNYSIFNGDFPEGVYEVKTITSIDKTKDQILKLINLYGQNNIYIKWYVDPSDLTSTNYTLSLSNYETYIHNENTYDSFVFIADGMDSGSLKLTLLLVFENGILSEGSNLFVTSGGYYEPGYYKNLIKDLTEGIINISTISEYQRDLPDNTLIFGAYSISSIDKSYNNILSMINECGSQNIILYDNIAFNTLVGNSTNINSQYILKITTYSTEDDHAILIFTGDIAEVYCGLAMLLFNYVNNSWVLDTSESCIMFGYSSFYQNIILGNLSNDLRNHSHAGYLTSQTKANWNETNTSSAAYIENKPTIPSTAEDVKALPDYSRQYLTFTALESGKFTFLFNALQYSLDDGATWNTLAANSTSQTVNAGNKIMWKQTGLIPNSSNGIGMFSSTGRFKVSGNVMSLYYGDNFIGQTDLTGKTYAFYGLFTNCTKLIDASNLILPATTLANRCYYNMFQSCTGLTTAPELPATTLANYCYAYMFYGCTSLTKAPKLPATTLAESCYSNMFGGCTALKTAPELSAATLFYSCYQYMFQGCTSLTTAPELPATTLANYCYTYMFYGCSSLITAPALPATILAEGCYQSMFRGCTALNYIKCLATDISTSSCTYNWVNGVAASGTFVKADSMSSWTTGNDGIPSNWIIINNQETKNVDIKYYKDNFSSYYQQQYDKRKLRGIWGVDKEGLVEDYDEFMEVYDYDSDAMFINAKYVVTSIDDAYHGLLYICNPYGKSTTETDTPESGQTTITRTFIFKGLMYKDGNEGGLATVLVNLIKVVNSSDTSTIISTELTSDCDINSIMLGIQYSTQYYIAIVSELPANPSQNTIYIVQ